MNYYYDTEFLEGTQRKTFFGIPIGNTAPTIDLISIGVVSDDGREYYAISKDFNLKEAWNRYDLKYNTGMGDANNLPPTKVYWIRENVLKPIFNEWKMETNGRIVRLGLPIPLNEMIFNYKNFKYCISKIGKSNKQIAEEVINFTKCQLDTDNDGNCPKHLQGCPKINLYGYYSAYDHVALCWLFGKMINLPKGFPMYTIDLKQMLDEMVISFFEGVHKGGRNLEDRLSSIKTDPRYPKETNAHNALADAKWNKELHTFIHTL